MSIGPITSRWGLLMFAPDGYVAIARLRGDFEHRYLKWCCVRACEFYQSDEYDQKDIFGSPRDLCEDLFLASLAKCDVTVCTPDGRTLHLPAALDGTNAKLFQKATVLESCSISMFPDEAGEEGCWLSRMGSPQFKPTDHFDATVAEWNGAYSKLAENEEELQVVNVPFHTLPFLYERQSMTIARSFPPWSRDMIDDVFRHILPDWCKGGSICLAENTAYKWREAQVEASLLADLVRLVPSVSCFSIGSHMSNGGRPRKIDEVKRLCREYEQELLLLTWKERLRFLERRAGVRVSTTTLRNAFRDLNAQK